MASPKRKTTKRAKKAKARPRAKATTTRSSGTRELITNAAGAFFGRRSGTGRFKEMDERGRSLAADRRRKAKTPAKRGQGDRGDRRR